MKYLSLTHVSSFSDLIYDRGQTAVGVDDSKRFENGRKSTDSSNSL